MHMHAEGYMRNRSTDSYVDRNLLMVIGRPGVGRDTLTVKADDNFKIGIIHYTDEYEPVRIEYGFFRSIPAGIRYGWNTLKGYVGDFRYVFTKEGAKNLGGFGTIGSIFPDRWNWYGFWTMTAFLSIILAFMNTQGQDHSKAYRQRYRICRCDSDDHLYSVHAWR